MPKVEEPGYEEWVEKAENDFKAAKMLLGNKKLTETAAFHLHQAIEKYLKAFLVYHQIYFPKVHNLVKLADLASQKTKQLAKFSKIFEDLDGLYIPSRYPFGQPPPSLTELKKFYREAESVTNFIQSQLKRK